MRHLVVTNGQDPLTKPIMDYLWNRYGIEPKDVQAVNLDSTVGDVQHLTVTLLVMPDEDTPPEITSLERTEFGLQLQESQQPGYGTSEAPTETFRTPMSDAQMDYWRSNQATGQ